jgi:integrase
MARSVAKLSAVQVRNAKPKGTLSDGTPRRAVMLSDGGNLYLQATLGDDGNLRKSWIFRYQLRGKSVRDMGLGSVDTFGLADAREAATEYRKLLKQGIDPISHRDAQVAQNLAAHAASMTFDQAAETYIRQHRAGWKSSIHAAQWSSTLKTYASPILGKLPVADISTAHVMKALDPIWIEKPETASRVRGRIEAVMGWAGASGFRKGKNGEDMPNPARWRDHLDQLLPAPDRVRKTKHQKALPYPELPSFMKELRAREGIAALALEFTILTGVRTADTRRARLADIDPKARMWTIPEFSKTHREHRVPLSDAALAAIDKVRAMVKMIGGTVGQSEFLFPNDRSGAALSENAMLWILDRMGRKGEATTHGFRSCFRTWAQERTNFPRELAEMCLGHTVGDKVERAYARGDALVKRAAIMQSWANFCGDPRAGKVIALQTRKA